MSLSRFYLALYFAFLLCHRPIAHSRKPRSTFLNDITKRTEKFLHDARDIMFPRVKHITETKVEIYLERIPSDISTKQLLYTEGDQLIYICTAPKSNICPIKLHLIHKKENYEITKIKGQENAEMITIVLILTEFDNGTTIDCNIHDCNGESNHIDHYTFNWNSKSPNGIKYDENMISPESSEYRPGDHLECVRGIYQRWHRVIGSEIDTDYKQPYYESSNLSKLPLNTNSSSDGDSYVCTAYNQSSFAKEYFERIVSKIVTLKKSSQGLDNPVGDIKDDLVTILSPNTTDALYTGWENKTIYYKEGQIFTFTCQTYRAGPILSLSHTKDVYEITNIIGGKDTYKLILNLIMTRFDNDTKLSCEVRDLEKDEIISESHYILISNGINAENEVKYDENMVTPKPDQQSHYNIGDIITCTGDMYQKWLRLLNSSIDIVYNTQDDIFLKVLPLNQTRDLSLEIQRADEGTSFVCIAYSPQQTSSGSEKYLRRVSKLIHVKMDDPVSHKTAYAIGAGCGILLFIVAVAIWKIWPRRRCQADTTIYANIGMSPSHHEVETYACPATVLYAELGTMTSDNTRKHIVKDDTPYAEIIGVLEPNSK